MENKTKLNQIPSKSFIRYTQKEEGITLVALIVTIVIMVIIAVISITIVYNSKIVEYAINGTQDYAKEGIIENKVLEKTESLIDSAIDNLKKINGGMISSIEPTLPEPTGLPREELSQETMIGKYVDYKSAGENYIIEGQYSGTGSNQTFAKNDDMKWRIWGVEDNKLLLISETATGSIQLQGANGYNNAVKILNDACSTAFGNSSYGSVIKVRSINQDDIDKVTNMTTDAQRKAVRSEYGTTVTPRNKQCPTIYNYEPGKTGSGGTLNRSIQYNNNSWVTGTSTMTSGLYTYYGYSISGKATNPMYYALLTNMSTSSTSGTTSHTAYWVASRCVLIGISNALSNVFYVGNGKVEAYYLSYTDGGTRNPSSAVRPVVEVDLEYVAIGATGSGTDTDPYSMAKK